MSPAATHLNISDNACGMDAPNILMRPDGRVKKTEVRNQKIEKFARQKVRGQMKAVKGRFGQHRTKSAEPNDDFAYAFGNTPLPSRGGVAPFAAR